MEPVKTISSPHDWRNHIEKLRSLPDGMVADMKKYLPPDTERFREDQCAAHQFAQTHILPDLSKRWFATFLYEKTHPEEPKIKLI